MYWPTGWVLKGTIQPCSRSSQPPLPPRSSATLSSGFARGDAPTSRAGIAPRSSPPDSPSLDRIAEHDLLSAHMLQHVLLGDLAPALLIVAVRGPLLFFLLPAPVLGPIARSATLRALLATLTRPPVAFGLWALNLAVWHVPAAYDAALTRPWLHDLEHTCWFLAGVLVWTLLVDPAGHGRLSTGGRLALAVALFAAGQVLTDVLVFSFTPLYPAYDGAEGISAVRDEQLAGLAMMVEQLLTLGTLAAFLLRPRIKSARLAPA